jgi:hypothetical protein
VTDFFITGDPLLAQHRKTNANGTGLLPEESSVRFLIHPTNVLQRYHTFPPGIRAPDMPSESLGEVNDKIGWTGR